MKRLVRSILVLTLLLVAAQPLFACPICSFQGPCVWGGGHRCKPTVDGCQDGMPCGGGGLTEPLAAEFTIASVEVTHDGDGQTAIAFVSKKEPAPAVVADARIQDVRSSTEQK